MEKTASINNTESLVFNAVWEQLMDDTNFTSVFLGNVLEAYIQKQRWYGGKSSKLKYIELSEYFKLQQNEEVYYGLILEVNFEEAFYQHYFLPIAFVTEKGFGEHDRILPATIDGKSGFIIDAIHLEAFRKLVFERILTAQPVDRTKVRYHKSSALKNVTYNSSRFMGLEQSNTSIVYNETYVLKFFRRIYSNKNPDYEMSRYLTEHHEFNNTPPYLGSINIEDSDSDIVTIALMQELVANQGDAWSYMLKEFERIFIAFETKNMSLYEVPKKDQFAKLNIKDLPAIFIDWVGLDFVKKIQTLAKRTAEMHIALGSEFQEMAFAPAYYNGDYEVWLKNRLLYQFQNRLNTVENNLHKLNDTALLLAKEFLNKKNSIRKCFVNFDWTKLKGQRIRVHGDYHLGQILVQNNDFYILDFEGEPESTIRDRKVKQPPLKDVAGLFRSFHYAIYTSIFNILDIKQNKDSEKLYAIGELLYNYITGLFLGSYINKVRDANLNIGYHQERIFLLKYAMLEKAVYELGYELNSRPHWAIIPLKGISDIMNTTNN